MRQQSCVFCDIIRGEAEASIVYAEERIIAFMDIQPVNEGHVLVVPRAHAAYVADLDPMTGGSLFEVGMKVAASLRQSGIRCDGVNFFLADGSAAGQEVFHVHLHVIPRFEGDGFGFRFPPGYRNPPARSKLEEAANRISRVLGS